MANHVLSNFFTLLAEGFRPGESLANFRNRLKGSEYHIEQAVEGHHTFFANTIGNNGTKVEVFAAPYDMEITGITARKSGAGADTATATLVADVGGSNDNPLSAANINVFGLTDNTTTAQALSATASKLLMKKGELLKCSWACGAAGSIADAVVAVHFKRLGAGQL